MAQTLKQTRDNHTNAFSCSHLPNLDDTGGELLCALPAADAFVHIHLRHNAFHDLNRAYRADIHTTATGDAILLRNKGFSFFLIGAISFLQLLIEMI